LVRNKLESVDWELARRNVSPFLDRSQDLMLVSETALFPLLEHTRQGFYYKQITGDSGAGAVLGDFESEATGIGPALMWATKIRETDVVLSAKWLHELV